MKNMFSNPNLGTSPTKTPPTHPMVIGQRVSNQPTDGQRTDTFKNLEKYEIAFEKLFNVWVGLVWSGLVNKPDIFSIYKPWQENISNAQWLETHHDLWHFLLLKTDDDITQGQFVKRCVFPRKGTSPTPERKVLGMQVHSWVGPDTTYLSFFDTSSKFDKQKCVNRDTFFGTKQQQFKYTHSLVNYTVIQRSASKISRLKMCCWILLLLFSPVQKSSSPVKRCFREA